jgi:hypothetical protein
VKALALNDASHDDVRPGMAVATALLSREHPCHRSAAIGTP